MTDFLKLPTFAGDGAVHAVIETPRHASAKYKYEPKLGCFALSRTLIAGLSYPFNWGFVPSTIAADGDPLDVAVLAEIDMFAGLVVKCRPLGVLEVAQTEQGKTLRNDRIFLSPVKADDRCSHPSVLDLPEARRRELEEFFVASVTGTGKKLEMLGWHGPTRATQAIAVARDKFEKQGKPRDDKAEDKGKEARRR